MVNDYEINISFCLFCGSPCKVITHGEGDIMFLGYCDVCKVKTNNFKTRKAVKDA